MDWRQALMNAFSKHKVESALSAYALPARSVSPSITTTTQGTFVDFSAKPATVTYSDTFTILPRLSREPSTTSSTHQQGRSSDMSKGERLNNQAVVVNAIAAGDATAAVVDYKGHKAYGSSKRNKHEIKDTSVGLDLAVGRALCQLGRDLVADANARLDAKA